MNNKIKLAVAGAVLSAASVANAVELKNLIIYNPIPTGMYW